SVPMARCTAPPPAMASRSLPPAACPVAAAAERSGSPTAAPEGGRRRSNSAVARHGREILEHVMMEYTARRPIRIGFLSLVLSVGMTGAALAQSGSAGGSIGNDEKSLSGSREKPRAVESSKPARRAKPESDEPRRASQKSGGGGGNFDGSWVAVAVGTPCGRSTERFVISGGRITGEWTSGQVSPNGSTTGHGSVPGLSWTSSGRYSGRTGSGSFVRSDGCTGRWTASKQ